MGLIVFILGTLFGMITEHEINSENNTPLHVVIAIIVFIMGVGLSIFVSLGLI